MKKIFMIAIALIAGTLVNAQLQTPNTAEFSFEYKIDEFTKKESLKANTKLYLKESDSDKRMLIAPQFQKVTGVWKYNGLVVVIRGIGNCVGADKLEILFEDETVVSSVSFVEENCDGGAGFDKGGMLYTKLNKSIKAIRFTNGVTGAQYTKKVIDDFQKNYFINTFKALKEFNSSK